MGNIFVEKRKSTRQNQR